MSFSRAKVTRFNEAVSHTPSPADYNVKHETSNKAVLIPKGERFMEAKSPVRSECSNSVHSAPTTQYFRTPYVPKKKKIFNLSGRKTKPTDLFSKKQKKEIIDHEEEDELDLEALKDKIVECNNKNLFIKDLTEQIEEMKEQLNGLERQKQILTMEKHKFEEACIDMREEHRIVMESAYLEYDSETKALKNEIHSLESQLIVEQEAIKSIRNNDVAIKTDLNTKLKKAKAAYLEAKDTWERTIEEKEKLVEMLQAEILRLENEVTFLEKKYEAEIASIHVKHKEEIVELEFTMLKSITDTQNMLEKERGIFEKSLAKMCHEHDQEKNKIQCETTAKIKQMEEDSKEASVLADIQMQEKCKDIELTWRITLEKQRNDSDAILKECQAISEYTITQSEWEKNQIRNELNRKIEDLKQFERDNADLNIALQETELKYNDLHKDMNDLKMRKNNEMEKCKDELQEMQQQKKLYEISISKAHDIIDTLKRRLLNSDHDVEQLKAELEICELSKLEFEARCNQLKDELDIITNQSKDLEEEYHDTLKKTDDRIAVLEIELIEKVEAYKTEALKQVDELVEQLREKQFDLDETLEQLHEEHLTNKKAFALIELANSELGAQNQRNEDLEENYEHVKIGFVNVQMQVEENEIRISRLQAENDQLTQRLSGMDKVNGSLFEYQQQHEDIDGLVKQLQQIQEKSDSYSQYCEYYKHKASEYEIEIEELEGINKKYIEQSGKYDTMLQHYEKLQERCLQLEKKVSDQDALIAPFRDQLEAYDLEHQALVTQEAAEDDAESMGIKYAQLMGSQNQAQKIKHMMDLKNKNYELAEENRSLESKLKSHAKTIEKLTKQLSTLQLHSPRKNKMQTGDKENVASPNRTSNTSRVESPGPLKERN